MKFLILGTILFSANLFAYNPELQNQVRCLKSISEIFNDGSVPLTASGEKPDELIVYEEDMIYKIKAVFSKNSTGVFYFEDTEYHVMKSKVSGKDLFVIANNETNEIVQASYSLDEKVLKDVTPTEVEAKDFLTLDALNSISKEITDFSSNLEFLIKVLAEDILSEDNINESIEMIKSLQELMDPLELESAIAQFLEQIDFKNKTLKVLNSKACLAIEKEEVKESILKGIEQAKNADDIRQLFANKLKGKVKIAVIDLNATLTEVENQSDSSSVQTKESH